MSSIRTLTGAKLRFPRFWRIVVFNNLLSRRRLYEYESRRPRQNFAIRTRRHLAAFCFQRVT
jgi:hypothetical protein